MSCSGFVPVVGVRGRACGVGGKRCAALRELSVARMTLGEWENVDFDPSSAGVQALSKACTYHNDMPMEVKNRRGGGAWSQVEFDASRASDVRNKSFGVDFDETHMGVAITVGKRVSAPKQVSRPERRGEGIWALADLDPSSRSDEKADFAVTDLDPSYGGFEAVRGSVAAPRQRARPAVEQNGLWSMVDVDPSRMSEVKNSFAVTDMDPSYNGYMPTIGRKEAPRQRAHQESVPAGIWASADMDPSRMTEEVNSFESADVDPSHYDFIIARTGRPTVVQRKQPLVNKEVGAWAMCDMDESYGGDVVDVWSRCDLDESSVGDVSLRIARKAVHAKMSTSSVDADGVLVDVDPSSLTSLSKKEKDDMMWSNVGVDESHVDDLVQVRRSSEPMIPAKLLWLLEADNRVFLETVAARQFIIIARSGSDVAAAFVREGADLEAVKAELPSNMGVYDVSATMYAFLHDLANKQFENFVSKSKEDLVIAGDGI